MVNLWSANQSLMFRDFHTEVQLQGLLAPLTNLWADIPLDDPEASAVENIDHTHFDIIQNGIDSWANAITSRSSEELLDSDGGTRTISTTSTLREQSDSHSGANTPEQGAHRGHADGTGDDRICYGMVSEFFSSYAIYISAKTRQYS